MRIITIGREFGSAGRELGKRLADALGIPCYDKEILNEVSKLQGITPDHVEYITQSDILRVYAGTIVRTLLTPMYYNDSAIEVMSSQYDVINKLAKQGDCVIVGRNADIVLKDLDPLNIFVYADEKTKIARFRKRDSEEKTDKEILKEMKKIDRKRAASRKIMTDKKWGDKETYHLCINTSGIEVKHIVPMITEYAKKWFEVREK